MPNAELISKYKPYLIEFMSHRDGIVYGSDHEFSVAAAPRAPTNLGAAQQHQPHPAEPHIASPSATLSRVPRTLHLLWTEYEVGIGGRKAAKDFTAHERGKEK